MDKTSLDRTSVGAEEKRICRVVEGNVDVEAAFINVQPGVGSDSSKQNCLLLVLRYPYQTF